MVKPSNARAILQAPSRRMVIGGMGASTFMLGHPALFSASVSFAAEHGAKLLTGRSDFDRLSKTGLMPGGIGTHQVKFLISKANTDAPRLYFINANEHVYHYDFLVKALNVTATNQAFNRAAYFSADRLYLAGSVVAYDGTDLSDSGEGLYTIEFWPTDTLSPKQVCKAYDLIKGAFNTEGRTLAFHPRSQMQEDRIGTPDVGEACAMPVITSDTIFKNTPYAALNPGAATGRIRIMDGRDHRPLGPMDIAVFSHLPNDLTPIAGVLTDNPQTPLSHVNVRAQQNSIPNAYLKGASTRDDITALDGRVVRLEIGTEGYDIRQATEAEMREAFEAKRPKARTQLSRDLSAKDIMPLSALSRKDAPRFGSKAANLAQLNHILHSLAVPDGHAVPFSFYHDFMEAAGLYTYIKGKISKKKFIKDPAARKKGLKKIRSKIKAAPVPESLRLKLGVLQSSLPKGLTPRCRSSANSEDLIGFSGAGLYDSYTHREDEGHISKSIKQVWASLWNFRAFEEREFYRIDHFTSAMGVLIHTNFDDEKVNGVAVTKNIYFPNLRGFYVNAQAGEALVTNPKGGAVPEEIVYIQEINADKRLAYEKITVRKSNLTGGEPSLLGEAHGVELAKHLDRIHSYFSAYSEPKPGPDFAMEIEFKVTKDDRLIIKQARPWVS